MFLNDEVSSIVKVLMKMVDRLERHHEKRIAEMAIIQQQMADARLRHQEHEKAAEQAKTIAENLKKVLGL